jgi:hypothetical protein
MDTRHGVELVTRLLEEEGAGWRMVAHEETSTAVDDAGLADVEPARAAKTVLLRDRDAWRVAVVPATERVDLDKARAAFRASGHLRLADEAEIESGFHDFEPGAAVRPRRPRGAGPAPARVRRGAVQRRRPSAFASDVPVRDRARRPRARHRRLRVTASVLIVAHRTAATAKLADAVRSRAERGPARFTLLVPRPYWDPDTEEAEITLELAIPLLDEAAGGHVEGRVSSEDAFAAVRDELERERYDEVIVSTLPERVSRWLRRDLPRRIEQLGVPVTVVTATQAARALR